MMTVLELLNAIENSSAGYDDPITFVRPVAGQGVETYRVVELNYDGSDGVGALEIMISRES